MKGVLLHEVGGSYTIVDNLEKPKPGKGQVLVKSFVTAINPAEGFMQSTGMLVTAWPIVLGCDASGVVVEIGEGVETFKVGDEVFGCTRLGAPGYGTFQEYFLMDTALTFKKPSNISTEEAATIGVGILTASLGLYNGVKLEPASGKTHDEWIVILGGAGSVGQFAIQLAKIYDYKIVTTCSPKNDELVKSFGADVTIDYKLPIDDQLQKIKEVTGGKFSRVFDASAMASETGMEALAQHGDSKAEKRYLSTTNDWMPVQPKDGVEIHLVTLGAIGKSSNAHENDVNSSIQSFIRGLEEYIKEGKLKPMAYEVVGEGMEGIMTALEYFNARKSSDKKVLVRVAAK